ncbi:hypothetical protein [Pseudoxanthomonas putridarboris]|uniref:Uncharacterized protein n=1 Tax=Pseudoxanthomonas putridarboris TaxID=752605 RepID=A0ABU9J5U9_9GAMM
MDDADLTKSFSSASPLSLSEQCLQSNLFDFDLHDGSELNRGGNSDLKPVFVWSLNGAYHVVFLRNGYFTGEGEGNELVASLAVYDLDGALEGSLDRVSSWRTHEGSLLLRESCIVGAGISRRELAFDPDVRAPDGRVVKYMSPDIQGEQMMYPDGRGYGFVEGRQKIDCDWSNYVSLQR